MWRYNDYVDLAVDKQRGDNGGQTYGLVLYSSKFDIYDAWANASCELLSEGIIIIIQLISFKDIDGWKSV